MSEHIEKITAVRDYIQARTQIRPPEQQVLETELIIRYTTAPAPVEKG